jgi:hypothetical protein
VKHLHGGFKVVKARVGRLNDEAGSASYLLGSLAGAGGRIDNYKIKARRFLKHLFSRGEALNSSSRRHLIKPSPDFRALALVFCLVESTNFSKLFSSCALKHCYNDLLGDRIVVKQRDDVLCVNPSSGAIIFVAHILHVTTFAVISVRQSHAMLRITPCRNGTTPTLFGHFLAPPRTRKYASWIRSS